MNNRMKLKYFYIIISTILFFVISCDSLEDSLELGTKDNLVGEWQVSAYLNDQIVSEGFQLDISNAGSTGLDSITITESGFDFWNFSVNAAFDLHKGVFYTQLSQCHSSDENIGIKIENGKIIGSDSIYFEIRFEDDVNPFESVYKVNGKRLNQ